MIKYYRREDVAGKEVVESEAKKVGIIRDLAFDLKGKLAFSVEVEMKTGELRESFLAFENIIKIGDIIMIKSSTDLEASPNSGKICPNCKGRNPQGACQD